MSKELTFTFTRERALQLGLLTCGNCGYPENNHFNFAATGYMIGDYGKGACAHDDSCHAYREVARR